MSEQYTKEEFHAYIDGLERARRQGQSDTLPGGDLLDLLDPTAREAFAMARKEG